MEIYPMLAYVLTLGCQHCRCNFKIKISILSKNFFKKNQISLNSFNDFAYFTIFV